jgi:hypothetical protein
MYISMKRHQAVEPKKRLGTYDLSNGITEIYDTVFNAELGENINIRTQFGSDSGLQYYQSIKTDGLNGNARLTTNRAYYYSVTAYGYNEYGIPKTLESSPIYLTVRPEVPNTASVGENTALAGDKLVTVHATGPSNADVEVVVVDVAAMTGDDYTVSMANEMPDGVAVLNWTLTNDTTGEVLITNNPVVNGLNAYTGVQVGSGGTPIVEGIQILVGPPSENLLAIEEWTAPWKDANEKRDASVSYLPPSEGTTGYLIESRAGVAYSPPYNRDFDRFNYWESDDIELDFSTESLGWDYIYEWTTGMLPFSAYRHNFATQQKEQMYAGHWDRNISLAFEIDTNYWAGPVYLADGYEPIYCFVGMVATPYDPTKISQYIAEDDLTTSGGCGWGSGASCDNVTTSGAGIGYPYMTATMITDFEQNGGLLPTVEGINAYLSPVLADGTGGDASPWNEGTETVASSVVFRMTKPHSALDTFTFTTDGVGLMANAFDPDRISVWPNPYYGYNPEERNALDRRVMFSHLPEEGPTTIRIFALDGTLVRTIHHNDTASQHATWDMKNNFELPVASGMYVAHVETNHGDKILKLAVIQPEQRLDVY